VRKTFCHRAGDEPLGIGKAMSVTTGTKSESGLGETIRVVIHALLIALVIRTFLFQPFNIPSGSMKATLLVGDYLFVSKYSYAAEG
jgi:signal peptidase I